MHTQDNQDFPVHITELSSEGKKNKSTDAKKVQYKQYITKNSNSETLKMEKKKSLEQNVKLVL